jgi:ferric-dicitrate binding protein FerR (iron transport regulator)
MTSQRDDDRASGYLWDPAAADAVDPEVLALEQRLAPVRFDPDARPLRLRRAAPRGRWPAARWVALAATAAVVATAAFGFSRWRWTWPAGQAWTVSTRSSSVPAELAVGAPLTLAPGEGAVVDVARIGTMRIDGGSSIALRSTQGSRHRLAMEAGRVSIRVWAPPGSLAIQTPAGEVIDLGCEFDLEVDASASRVRVRSGWVQLENGIDESLIPAGASSEMTRAGRPGVPVFDNADPAFRAAVRRYELTGDAAVVETIVGTARVEDMLTLLDLVDRGTAGTDRIASRAAELWPLPDGVTVGGIVRGDRDGLWRWRDTLPLPPVKSWLRNWRDALPQWLAPGAR